MPLACGMGMRVAGWLDRQTDRQLALLKNQQRQAFCLVEMTAFNGILHAMTVALSRAFRIQPSLTKV